jgi:cell filamentation protein, protein adenylyltransferase
VRQYKASHPWITFVLELGRLDHETWMLLGEAVSKIEHVAGVPLQPAVADELNLIYLSKSAHATTQIEGNTLSAEEVRRVVEQKLVLPPSQEYLAREVENIVAAYNLIIGELLQRRIPGLTVERIKEFNQIVLDGLPREDEYLVPGEIRTKSVVVGRYRGAPAEDCEYLLARLCAWLKEFGESDVEHLRRPLAILAAILAHLYLAWIHPFWDGNGRTARLVEFQLLLQARLPVIAAHLLSDFYNRTRSEYYRVLDRTSRPPFPVEDFIKYAVRGLVDELTEQISTIRSHQLEIIWHNYIHNCFRGKNTPACVRQRLVMLALPSGWTPISALPRLTTELAVEYHRKTAKTVTRDVNALVAMDLVARDGNAVRPRVELMQAFLPPRAEDDEDKNSAARPLGKEVTELLDEVDRTLDAFGQPSRE